MISSGGCCSLIATHPNRHVGHLTILDFSEFARTDRSADMDEARGHLLDYVERISPQIRGILKKKAHLMPDTTIFQDTEEAIHDLVISCWEMSQSQREVLDPRYAQGLAAALENCATPPRSEATESESRQPALSPAQYLQPEQLFTDLLSSQIGFLNGSSEADWDWLLART